MVSFNRFQASIALTLARFLQLNGYETVLAFDLLCGVLGFGFARGATPE